MRGRHERHHDKILAFARDASEFTTLNKLEISSDVGIIASGRPAALAEGLGVSLLSLGYSNPLPGRAPAPLYRWSSPGPGGRGAGALHRVAAGVKP